MFVGSGYIILFHFTISCTKLFLHSVQGPSIKNFILFFVVIGNVCLFYRYKKGGGRIEFV